MYGIITKIDQLIVSPSKKNKSFAAIDLIY